MKKHPTKWTAVEPELVSLTPALNAQINLPWLALNTRQLLQEFML